MKLASVIWLILLSVCLANDRYAPETLVGSEITRLLQSSNASTYDSISFYSNRLYAVSITGLLEIENGSIIKLYRWGGGTSALEGLWLDNAHCLLWVYWSDSESHLACYDGASWRDVKFPEPLRSYFSRGEMLRGFRRVSNRRTFWLEGAGCAWRWKGPWPGIWTEEALYQTNVVANALLKRVIPTESSVFFVKRGDKDWDWLVGLQDHPRLKNNPKRLQLEAMIEGDSVWLQANGQWHPVLNRGGAAPIRRTQVKKDIEPLNAYE